MKTVTIEEFRAHVDQYLAETAQGEVLLTHNGKPWVILRAAAQEPDVDSSAFAKSPEFWRMIAERRRENGIPWDEAQKLLDLE